MRVFYAQDPDCARKYTRSIVDHRIADLLLRYRKNPAASKSIARIKGFVKKRFRIFSFTSFTFKTKAFNRQHAFVVYH
ncbi:hypothetical protein AC791_05200 [Klebsiella sp. RIT-PI-d]|nr:hypothetical protein AC791_05200 [Klebsiella sp. RIT-PI-d]